MKRIAARGLPGAPLEAQAAFTALHQPAVLAALENGEDVLVELDPADHTHGEWRRAAAAMLARAQAPSRVAVVAGEAGASLDAVATYFAAAPGVTGQYLECAADFSAD